MKKYDPDRPVDPQGWLELDESQRITFVELHHRRAGVRLPNAHLHAVIHTIVENQLASNEPEVVAALGRLSAEGLSRHDAVHAIGQVLATTMNEGVTGVLGSDLNASYADRFTHSQLSGGSSKSSSSFRRAVSWSAPARMPRRAHRLTSGCS